ncbi:alkaline phosphatase family protein [Gorillibacterium sp. CAU 1737]|uniref:alkaline phosphatase family protein n=1 Tax=Gorillibacterium sp. CAU 1737 TaxID=3140362 RepID=UPI0032605C31
MAAAAPGNEPKREFSGRVSLIGAEHAVPGSIFRLSLHLYTSTPEVSADRLETNLWFDRRFFAFERAEGAAGPVRSEPGRLRLAAEIKSPMAKEHQGEYRASRVVQLYFRALSGSGESDIILEGTRIFQKGEPIRMQRLMTDHARVRLHPRSPEDKNGDGLVSIGDLAVSAGAADERKIAEKLQIYPYKRVIVIGLDGAGNAVSPDAPYYPLLTAHSRRIGERFRLPHLRSLLEKGAVSYTVHSSEPTSSSPNWGAMLTGVEYGKHGVSNQVSGEAYYGGRYPTVFSRLRELAPERRLAFFSHWSHLRDGHIEPEAGVSVYSGEDDALVNQLVRYIESGQAVDTSLVFLVLDEVDNAGHARGWFTRSYYQALEQADQKVGRIYEALSRNGLLDDTLVLFVADHGGGTTAVGKALYRSRTHSHGGKQAATVFFGASGRTVAGERRLTGGRTRDVAATILSALGDERRIGDSRPLPGMFRPKEAGQASPDRMAALRSGKGAAGAAASAGIAQATSGAPLASPGAPSAAQAQQAVSPSAPASLAGRPTASVPSAPASRAASLSAPAGQVRLVRSLRPARPGYELSLAGTGSRTKAAVVRLSIGMGSRWNRPASALVDAVPLAPGVRAYLLPDPAHPGEVRLVVTSSGLLPLDKPLVRLVRPLAPAKEAVRLRLRPIEAAVADRDGVETLPAVKVISTLR